MFFKDTIKDWFWEIYDKATGKHWPPFVDQYKPQNGSTTILKFITSSESKSNASGTLVGMGLVVLSISAIVEGLLFSKLKKVTLNYAIDAVSKGTLSNFAEVFQ